MRRILIVTAAVAGLYVFVTGRKAARLAEKNTRHHEPVRRLRAAAHQKPGQVPAAKIPKAKKLHF